MDVMVSVARSWLIVAGLVLVFVVAPHRVWAEGDRDGHGEEQPSSDSAVLLVLITAQDPTAGESGQRFVTQLRLALDGFDVQALRIDKESFENQPLSQQIEWIRPHSTAAGAAATVWLEQTGGETTLLHLVALSAARALVRIVEAPRGPGTAQELALAVQELLGEAYLMSSTPHSPAVADMVNRVRDDLALDPEPVAEAPPPAVPGEDAPTWRRPQVRLATKAFLSGGVAGHRGRQTAFGGQLALEIAPAAGLSLALEIAANSGPRSQVDRGSVTGWGISPGLCASYLFGPGRLQLGPRIGVRAVYTRVTVHPDSAASQAYAWWNLRGTLGATLLWRISDAFALVVSGELGFFPIRKSFRWISDDTQRFMTPFIDGSIAIGGVVWL